MNEQTPTATERAEKLKGLGCARKRVEDARFTHGKGTPACASFAVGLR